MLLLLLNIFIFLGIRMQSYLYKRNEKNKKWKYLYFVLSSGEGSAACGNSDTHLCFYDNPKVSNLYISKYVNVRLADNSSGMWVLGDEVHEAGTGSKSKGMCDIVFVCCIILTPVLTHEQHIRILFVLFKTSNVL